MKLWLGLILGATLNLLFAGYSNAAQWQVASPDGQINLQLELTADALHCRVKSASFWW